MNSVKVILTMVAALTAFALVPILLFVFLKLPDNVGITISLLPGLVIVLLVFSPVKKRNIKAPNLIYNDRFVEIYSDHLQIAGAYLGPFGRIKVPFAEIKNLEIVRFKGSCLRWQGTGDFKTWYAQDLKRHKKKENFVVESTRKKGRLGFSVEDSDAVSAIFRDKGLLKET